MKWIEISVTAERVVIDEVTTLFDTLTVNGSIEEDIPEEPDKVRLVFYGDANIPEAAWQERVENELSRAKINYDEVTTKTVTDDDWYNSWQQYIQPTEILPGVIIKPAWQAYEASEGETIIEIDSELSFGTGAHETTQACAELMAKYGKEKKVCLDIGTGTAILLLIAHVLGIPELIGVDIDPEAAAQAQKNCKANAVDATVYCGDLDSEFHGKADLVMANLTVDPLKIVLPGIGKKMTKDGILIISGIIDERYEEIMPYITAHWQIKEELVKGPWHTLALVQAE